MVTDAPRKEPERGQDSSSPIFDDVKDAISSRPPARTNKELPSNQDVVDSFKTAAKIDNPAARSEEFHLIADQLAAKTKSVFQDGPDAVKALEDRINKNLGRSGNVSLDLAKDGHSLTITNRLPNDGPDGHRSFDNMDAQQLKNAGGKIVEGQIFAPVDMASWKYDLINEIKPLASDKQLANDWTNAFKMTDPEAQKLAFDKLSQDIVDRARRIIRGPGYRDVAIEEFSRLVGSAVTVPGGPVISLSHDERSLSISHLRLATEGEIPTLAALTPQQRRAAGVFTNNASGKMFVPIVSPTIIDLSK